MESKMNKQIEHRLDNIESNYEKIKIFSKKVSNNFKVTDSSFQDVFKHINSLKADFDDLKERINNLREDFNSFKDSQRGLL